MKKNVILLIKSVAIVVVILLLTTSCYNNNTEKSMICIPKITADQVYMYNPFTYQLGIYDFGEKEFKEIDFGDLFVQGFDFGNKVPYYVIGSPGKKFYIVKLNENNLQITATFENGVDIAPIDTYDGERYYLSEKTSEELCYKRVFTVSENGTISEIANLDGYAVMYGVISDGKLYFTCSVENAEDYEVYVLDLTKKSQKPKCIKKHYSSFKLYRYEKQVLFFDETSNVLYSDEIKIKLRYYPTLLAIDELNAVIIEQSVNEDNDLSLIFFNVENAKKTKKYDKVLNFQYKSDKFIVLGNGYTETLSYSEITQ